MPSAALLTVWLLLALAQPAGAQPCPGIAPSTAQAAFARMQAVSAGAGYRFEGVSTDDRGVTVRWSRDGTVCPPLRIEVTNCTSLFGLARLQVHARPEVFERCPGLRSVVATLQEVAAAERPVGQGGALAADMRWTFAGVVALALGVVLAARRLLLSRAGRWGDLVWLAIVGAAAAPFLFNVQFAATAGLGAAWIAFAILLVNARLLEAEQPRERLALLALFAFALLLRWWWHSGGPGDLHLNLADVWSSAVDVRWGHAPIALFRTFALGLGGLRDAHIVWFNMLLGSLVPVLLYAIVAKLGVPRGAALLAAVVVAAHPFPIAFSGVLERQPVYLFAAFGSSLALLACLREGRWSDFVTFVLGAVLAITSRPEGAQVLVVYIAALLLVPAPRRTRGAAGLTVVALFGLAYAYVHGVLINIASQPFPVGALAMLQSILFSPDFTPLAWSVAVGLGLAIGIRRRAAWMGLLILLGLDLTWRWTGMYRMFVDHERQVASARYEALLLLPFIIGLALLIEALRGARPWLRAAAAALFVAGTAATWARPAHVLLEPFTVDHEYRFLAAQAQALPAGARLYVVDPPFDDTGFIDAHLVGRFISSPIDFRLWSERRCDDLPADSSYVYIGSACAELLPAPRAPLSDRYADWLRECAAMRARLQSDVIAELDVPARRMSWHDFAAPRVRLGVYRVRDAVCSQEFTTEGR